MICQIEACPHKDSSSNSASVSSGDEIYYSDSNSSGNSGSSPSGARSRGLTEMENRNNSENVLRTLDALRNSPYINEDNRNVAIDSMQQVSSDNDRRMLSVIESNEQSISVHHEKQSFLCRALQYRWLLFQNNGGPGGVNDNVYENAYLMLDPELQPISPATDIPDSMRIFEEHKRLAQDYLQTQTEIACLIQAKEDLEKQLAEEEQYGPFRDQSRTFQEMRELKSENESLVQYHTNLKKQLEIIKGRKQRKPTTPEAEPEPGWVMVPRRGS